MQIIMANGLGIGARAAKDFESRRGVLNIATQQCVRTFRNAFI